MKKKSISMVLGTFLVMAMFPLPSTKAAEPFSPTVKIVSYEQYLNGQQQALMEGSGTIITPEGKILTNAHVIMNEDSGKPMDSFAICVNEDSKQPPLCRFTATLIKYDNKIDLALLQIKPNPIWGAHPGNFPYLTYDANLDPQEGDSVSVRGFSASGGSTINTTQGQISGFETMNGFSYIKTDADIDAGNSGGTMLDANGNFIGVPSYVISYYETSGRVLSNVEVKKWMDQNGGQDATPNLTADSHLNKNLQRAHAANENKQINYSDTPGLSIPLPTNWSFNNVSDQHFNLMSNNGEGSYLDGTVINAGFKRELNSEERLKLYSNQLADAGYSQQEVIPVGKNNAYQGYHFWEEGYFGDNHLTIIPYGYHELQLSYFVAKKEAQADKAAIHEFLSTLSFSSPDQDNPTPSNLLNEDAYPFTMSLPTDWRIAKDERPGTNLALAGAKTSNLQTLDVYYSSTSSNQPPRTPDEGLDYDLNYYVPYDAEVTFQSSDLVVNGLKGWIYFYDVYQDDNSIEKVASATLIDPEYELYFDYRDSEENFEPGLKDFVYALKSFKSKRYQNAAEWGDALDVAKQGVYQIPLPESTPPSPQTPGPVQLSDIAGHRYEANIQHLVELGVINGNPDGTFDPESPVNRAAALKIILESLRQLQQENGETPFVMPTDFDLFSDMPKDVWYATYVAEGVEKKIVEGYADGTFKGENPVNLAETLKMLLLTYDVPVWSGTTEPWYKAYFDGAYKIDLLPRGLEDPAHLVTRAELAYMVDQMVGRGL